MNLPKIDISALPDLETMTGVFGSSSHSGTQTIIDDSLIELMVYVYEILHGGDPMGGG